MMSSPKTKFLNAYFICVKQFQLESIESIFYWKTFFDDGWVTHQRHRDTPCIFSSRLKFTLVEFEMLRKYHKTIFWEDSFMSQVHSHAIMLSKNTFSHHKLSFEVARHLMKFLVTCVSFKHCQKISLILRLICSFRRVHEVRLRRVSPMSHGKLRWSAEMNLCIAVKFRTNTQASFSSQLKTCLAVERARYFHSLARDSTSLFYFSLSPCFIRYFSVSK